MNTPKQENNTNTPKDNKEVPYELKNIERITLGELDRILHAYI